MKKVTYLKGRVYRDRPETLDALKQAITREIQSVQPNTLRKVSMNFEKRLQKIQEQNKGHFENLL